MAARNPEIGTSWTYAAVPDCKKREAGGTCMNCFPTRLLLMTLAILTLSVSSFAQSTGALVGTVHDATGAVIQGATVVATEPSTAIATQRTTYASGDYAFPSLATGTYKVAIAANGFKQLAV